MSRHCSTYTDPGGPFYNEFVQKTTTGMCKQHDGSTLGTWKRAIMELNEQGDCERQSAV